MWFESQSDDSGRGSWHKWGAAALQFIFVRLLRSELHQCLYCKEEITSFPRWDCCAIEFPSSKDGWFESQANLAGLQISHSRSELPRVKIFPPAWWRPQVRSPLAKVLILGGRSGSDWQGHKLTCKSAWGQLSKLTTCGLKQQRKARIAWRAEFLTVEGADWSESWRRNLCRWSVCGKFSWRKHEKLIEDKIQRSLPGDYHCFGDGEKKSPN